MALKKYKDANGEAWHGYNSLPVFYSGNGYLIKPHYSEHGDRSGHALTGFEIYYYGTLAYTERLPSELYYSGVADQEKHLDKLAKRFK